MSEQAFDPEEVAALLALDALEADEQADAELHHGDFPADLAATAAALAEPTVLPPPPRLRAQILSAALRRRPAGRPSAAAGACTPLEAFERSVADFAALLAALTPEDWRRPAHPDHGTVHDLVAHLVGVEQLSAGWLDPERAPGTPVELDHLAATRPVIEELRGAEPAAVAKRWEAAARNVAAVARRGNPQRIVPFHDLAGDVDALLVTRTFELWAHGMDIAAATERPRPALDDERMALMSARLMAAMPFAVAYRGGAVGDAARDARVRFVLTGAAGGTYDVPLGRAAAGDPIAATVVADVVDVCRVAARRLPAEQLAVVTEGDAAVAGAVLAAVDAFARD